MDEITKLKLEAFENYLKDSVERGKGRSKSDLHVGVLVAYEDALTAFNLLVKGKM